MTPQGSGTRRAALAKPAAATLTHMARINLIEAAELDPEQEAKLERELSRHYRILTRDDRLETVARDIVQHFCIWARRGRPASDSGRSVNSRAAGERRLL